MSATTATATEKTHGITYWLTRFLPLLVIGLAAAFALRRLNDPDTWWHLAAGRWIVTHRTIPHFDTLSWTVPDHPWINLQWLFDVIIYWIYMLGGPTLLALSSMTVYTTTITLMVVNLRRHADTVVVAALCAWALLISQDRFEIRPEMATYLFFQIILWLYATGRVANSKRLWAIPAVMCLWANCHALFILGCVVVVCQMVGSLITDLPLLPQGWRRPLEPAVRKQVLTTGAVALAATLINPFFIKGAAFPFMLMSRISGENRVFRTVGEARPSFEYFTTAAIAYKVFFFFAVAVVLTALVIAALQRSSWSIGAGKGLSRAERRRLVQDEQRRKGAPPALSHEQPQEQSRSIVHIDLADIAVFAGIAYLSLLARRNMALIAMGGAPCVAACLALIAARFPRSVISAWTRIKGVLAAVMILLVLVGYWFIASNGYYKWNGDLREFGLGQLGLKFSMRAASFIKTQRLPGPLYNGLDDGGYLTWLEPIPGGVYIDGRLEVYDTDFFTQYRQMMNNPSEWQAEMDRQGVQTVLHHWWGNTQLFQYLIHDSRWALVYYDETSVLLVRRTGNEDVISRALSAFTAERGAIEGELLKPVRSLQWPIGRVYNLQLYGDLLDMIGKSNDAARFRTRLAEINSSDR